ncbi:hypothetical protein [Xanthomarina spongicola]|uniref:Uncharacterized protein n=1 Tax=Xanthomarina spongicola TaxID=570520 RepID=A0A316DL28_9FLAO|nr:hypothetical protein [Xanthomarina spongicola]PWK17919.1 hypothetical protein LX78_02318 [Xanthomarina spongicola]
MFTDKQSLILCAIVVFGFSISGILGILDNYVIIAVLALLFVLIVVNLVMQKPIEEKDAVTNEFEDSKSSPNVFSNDNI